MYEAIFRRKSVRKYRKEELEERILKKIERFEQMPAGLWPDIRVKWKVFRGDDRRVKGLFRVKAPSYAALYSEPRGDYEANAGFLMEQLALYLHTQGIGSCCQGGIRLKKDGEGMEPVMVMAFGRPAEALERARAQFHRMELGRLVRTEGSLGKVQRKLLEAARLAPSAFNRQPWRFVVKENRIHLFAQKPGLLDSRRQMALNLFGAGAALAHMLVAAEELWIDLEYEKLDSILEKEFCSHCYVGSLRLRNEFRAI